MYPLIEWGGFRWPTFGPIAVLALALAFGLAERRARAAGLPRWTMLSGTLYIVGGAWLGARVVPMIVDPSEAFASGSDFLRGFLFTAGAWYGGLAGGLAGLILFARRRGLSVATLLDVVGPPLILSQVVGRFACLAAGCDHGHAAGPGVPWAITFRDPRSLVDPALLSVPLHPVQIYESLGCLAILAALVATAARRRRPGSTFLSAVAAYAALRFGVEFFRGDAGRGLYFGGALSTSQILSVVAAAVVVAVVIARRAAAPRSMAVARTLLVLSVLGAGRALAAEGGVGNAPVEALRRAAEELSSDDFATRERATRLLSDAGESARSLLETVRRSADPEARHRAESLLAALAWRTALTPALESRIPDLARRLASARGDDLLVLVRDLHLLGAEEATPALALLFSDEGRVAGIEAALLRSDLDVRIDFQSALVGYAGPATEKILLALARSPHAILRRGAAEALGEAASAEARRALEELSRHPDPETAAAASRGLERTARPLDLVTLLAIASNPKEPEAKRRDVVTALGDRGDRRAVETLVPLLSDEDLGFPAAFALAALEAREATPALLERLGPPDDAAVKDAFLFALARCAGLSAKSYLLLVLESRLASETTASEIFAGLDGAADEEVARAALHRLGADAPAFLAIEAVPLLAPLRDGEVVPVLARQLASDADDGASRTLAFALARRGAAGRDALREIAAKDSAPPRARAAALAALARARASGGAPADRALASAHARSNDPLIRGAAVRLLVAVDGAAAREAVLETVEALSRGRGSFRPGLPDALRALGEAGAAEYGARIQALARDAASLAVVAAAVEALFDLGDVAAVRALVAGKPGLDVPLRVVVAREIARRGSRDAADLVAPLLEIGNSRDFLVESDGAEPSIHRRRAPRDVALAALATVYSSDPGGADPAARAAAWRARLGGGKR